MINCMQDRSVTAAVTAIQWERIHLSVFIRLKFAETANSKIPLQFYAVNEKGCAKAIFQAKPMENGQYHLSLNITNAGNKRCLPNGIYRIAVCQGEHLLSSAIMEPSMANKLADCSRNFIYGNNKKTYTVSFRTGEKAGEPQFLMQILCAEQISTDYEKWLTIPGKAEIRQTMKKIGTPMLQGMYDALRRSYLRTKNHNRPTVLFLHVQGEKLGNNQLAVLRRMKMRGLDKQFRVLSYVCGSMGKDPRRWKELIQKLAISDFVFLEDFVPLLDWVKLDEHTTVVQLWHAGAGFKSAGYSRWDQQSGPAPVGCHRQYKYGIAGSKQIAPFFSEVWGINNENVLPTGMPRIDRFLNEAHRAVKKEALYEQYPQCKEKQVILFAPTFRGRDRKQAFYPYEQIDFDRFYEQCGKDTVVLFKMHPWVNVPVPIKKEHQDKFIDVSDYPDINDLFYITDLLITDYSSNIYEFSLMKKPMLFFAFDEVQYSFTRGFHRNYRESVPGKVCGTFDELLNAIAEKNFDFAKVSDYVEKHFDHLDSNASDRVIDWILLGNLPSEFSEAIKTKEAEYREVSALDFSTMNNE